ncbi:MAG: hypothetical protein ACOY81_02155 [Bacillota bacterium]
MSEVLERIMGLVFWLAIAVAIGLLIYHWLPDTAQAWIQTQINAVFSMGTNLINDATTR